MKSLVESNPYLRDPKKRRQMLEENARASSMMEGARGLPKTHRPASRAARTSAKKAVSKS
jgi:hypothetical protein